MKEFKLFIALDQLSKEHWIVNVWLPINAIGRLNYYNDDKYLFVSIKIWVHLSEIQLAISVIENE